MMPTWSEEMMKNWSDAQKRYWDAWSDLAKMGQENGTVQTTPAWTQGLDQWWKAVSPHTMPGASSDTFKRMVDMGRVYMNLAENAYKVQQNGAEGVDAMNAWMDTMENAFQACCTQLDAGKFTAHGFGVGQAAMDSWQQVMKSIGMQAFQQMGAGGFEMPMSQNWQEQLEKVLAAPAVGFNRESQQRLQELAQLGANYQEAMDDYLKAFAKQGLESVEALRARVKVMSEEGKSISTLRELYDLWVEVNEEIYGKFAMTDEYQVVYGDMVNALMALRQGINAELDSTYAAANLPTRKALDAAFEKQQEVRRENRTLRKQLQALSRKVDALASVAPATPAPAQDKVTADTTAATAAPSATAAKPATAKPKTTRTRTKKD